MKKYISLIAYAFLLILVLTACGKEEVSEVEEVEKWGSYTISYAVEDSYSQEASNLLRNIVLENTGEELELVDTSDFSQSKKIYLGGEELASKTGVVLTAINEMGYLITNDGNSYYVYAKAEKGFRRALKYMEEILFSNGAEVMMLEETYLIDTGDSCIENIWIGEYAIEEYSIVIEENPTVELKEVAEIAQEYILEATGIYVPVLETSENKQQMIQIAEISSSNSEFTYKYNISYGKIQILGKDSEACEEAVYDLMNTYFGWSFAGESREKVIARTSEIHIPANVVLFEDEPWRKEREAIVCLWKIDFARGVYLNQHTNLYSDLMTYSDEQLYDYVKMLKQCGFTGIQVTDMCSAWAGSGDYDYVHERMRIMADAAHSMGMKFTVWVWGAEFDGYGWTDDEVYYDFEGYPYLQENPRALELFDKYYSIYAELADCTDRVIGHYYDPGNLHASEDIGFYANMLKEKFTAVNPDIDFGINCWSKSIDKNILVEYLGNDITIYEGASAPAGEMVNFRMNVDQLNCRLGTWSWGKAEAEVDQLAQMSVNAEILKEVYQNVKLIDESYPEMIGEYWSEMDSYHVLNVFSLYCAGHLLANPDRDPEELLRQVSRETVGTEYEDDFYEILDLIQDARTGGSQEYMGWGSEKYIYRNDEVYNPEEILERCNLYIPILDQMIEEEPESNSLVLPIDLADLLKLIRPQLEQIKKFAEFRLGMFELEEDYANGMSKNEIYNKLENLYEPIPEYNGVIGLWGQVESRVQYFMIEEFCEKVGINVPDDSTFIFYRKMRIYQHLCSNQKGLQEPYLAEKDFYQWGYAYGTEETIALVNELVEEGLFIETEEGQVYLTDWKNYIYDFN